MMHFFIQSYNNFLKMSTIQSSPIVYPTEAQFNNFHAYMEYLEKTYSHDYGLIKVVPPPGWKATDKSFDTLDSTTIPGPIEQNAYGRGGSYECAHISSNSMTLGEFKRRIKPFQHTTDGLSNDEIQNLFWKNVAFSSPLYAADIKLNLMDPVTSGSWDLNNLDSVLSEGMKYPLPGVNTSYCYFGSWKSFFCWHTEDMELSAINFLHAGKPKFWYAVCPSDRHILQQEARSEFPNRFQKCSQHIRHKTTLISPYRLKSKQPNLRIHKQVQYPGQFILAFSGAYHSGFNSGFNIAQAVNYATFKWLKDIKTARYCRCRRDSVRISEVELAQELMKSKLNNHPEVIQFYETTKRSIQEQQNKEISKINQKQEKKKQIEKDKVLIQKAIKHKKIKKNSTTVRIQGQQFNIDNWAQCDKCDKWRRINFKLKKNQAFTCKKIGFSCERKQQSSKQYITLAEETLAAEV